MPRDLVHRAAFESHGETHTRLLAQLGGEVGAEATAWLGEQQSLRDEAASTKRDAREEETLSIARKALAASDRANELVERANSDAEKARSIARRANTIAITAAILATAATIIAAVIGVIYASPK